MKLLTDTHARNLAPRAKPAAAGGVPGLFLFPSSVRGHGKWILRFVSPITGKRRDMGLGKYPEIGVSAARKAGLSGRESIASGHDPIEIRRLEEHEQLAEAALPTFEEAARSVHHDLRSGFRNGKHSKQWINTLATYVFPTFGSRRVNELRASDFAEVLRPIWLTKPETASRVRQRCDAVMNWCAARDYILAIPLHLSPVSSAARR